MSTSDPDPRAMLAALGVAGIAAVERVQGGSDTAVWRVEAGWRRGYCRSGSALRDLDPFYAWAGVVMAHDLAAKRDAAFLARVRRWTAARQTRAIRRAGRWRDDNL